MVIRVDDVNPAGHARIERMDRPQDFKRFLHVGDRCAEQRFLVWTASVLGVARACVPCAGDDALVMLIVPLWM